MGLPPTPLPGFVISVPSFSCTPFFMKNLAKLTYFSVETNCPVKRARYALIVGNHIEIHIKVQLNVKITFLVLGFLYDIFQLCFQLHVIFSIISLSVEGPDQS